MKYTVLAMGLVIVILLIVLVAILSSKSKKAKPSRNNKNSNKVRSDYQQEEQDYRTEAIGSNQVQRPKGSQAADSNADQLGLGRVPVLDQWQKTEVMSRMNNSSREVGGTVFLNTDSPNSGMGVGVTETLKRTERQSPYAVLEYKENGSIKRFEIYSSATNIGRDPELCDLIVSSDNFMGRNHALVYLKNNRFFIVDLYSKNGTYVKGERIQGYKELETGCTLRIANTEMTFKSYI